MHGNARIGFSHLQLRLKTRVNCILLEAIVKLKAAQENKVGFTNVPVGTQTTQNQQKHKIAYILNVPVASKTCHRKR